MRSAAEISESHHHLLPQLRQHFSTIENLTKTALFLDYDGTLREYESVPNDAILHADLIELFDLLETKKGQLDVYIISGRDRSFLESTFAKYEFLNFYLFLFLLTC